MPNWCKNHVKLTGNSGQIKKINENIIEEREGKQEITFSKLIPMPKELEETTSPTREPNEELKKKFGADNWYDWRYQNWGVKWDACDTVINGEDDIEFNTPWNPPVPFFLNISKKYKHVSFVIQFADEFLGQFPLGEITITNGKITKEKGPKEGTKKAEKLADRIWMGEWADIKKYTED